MWTCSNVYLAFLFIALIIAVILALTIITQKDCQINKEYNKANKTRAAFLFAIVFALGFLVLIFQSKEKVLWLKSHL